MTLKPGRLAALLLAAALFFLVVWAAFASVTLSSFTPTPGDGLVRLDWETGSELDFAGFFVRRSQADDGDYAQWGVIEVEDAETGDLQTFVPARDDFGALYPFIDRNVQNSALYCYALEAVNNNQTREYFPSEPACITAGPTPTPTATQEETGTPTITATFTRTPGGTPPTATRTRLPTRTPAPTRTGTLIPSITPTSTKTPTVTVTPTVTPFPTYLPTWTDTPTATLTPSRTPLPSHTPGPLLAATLSPRGRTGLLANLGVFAGLTLGELILAIATAIALVGGVLFAALYFLVLRSSSR